ncbi:GtrA family protein [Georgenia sp. Z1344]|uniref:GtrA family protein n=1 Tax=Georgenia sp. Z1344 TaxID=3416706 RepID=UPI003CF4FF99
MRRLIDLLLRGQTWREWWIEFLRFCTVGLSAFVVDIGLFNLLRFGPGELLIDKPLTAKVISVAVSIVVAWTGNRLWTFREKRRSAAHREALMFLLVNIGGMLVAVGCLAFSHYVLRLTSPLADNISANGVGLVLGTAFRYVCYRYVVFTEDHSSGGGADGQTPTPDDDPAAPGAPAGGGSDPQSSDPVGSDPVVHGSVSSDSATADR